MPARHYGASGQLCEAGDTRYTYDEEGNLVRKVLLNGKAWAYIWDGAGLLASVQQPDGDAVKLAYHALG